MSDGSISNDDGDGMVESVTDTSSGYLWTAYINSKNIPDGPITVVTVAYDAAGYYSIKKTNKNSIYQFMFLHHNHSLYLLYFNLLILCIFIHSYRM